MPASTHCLAVAAAAWAIYLFFFCCMYSNTIPRYFNQNWYFVLWTRLIELIKIGFYLLNAVRQLYQSFNSLILACFDCLSNYASPLSQVCEGSQIKILETTVFKGTPSAERCSFVDLHMSIHCLIILSACQDLVSCSLKYYAAGNHLFQSSTKHCFSHTSKIIQ